MIDYRGNGTDGHTIPHHLGVAPDWVVVKAYSRSGVGWMTYSSGMTLNESSPNWYGNWERSEVWSDAASNIGWSDSAPTSTVFSLGENANFNDDDEDYIAFCFKNIDGFSKTGYYTGSGSQTNGTFVYTGFRPAFVLITKVNGSGSHWLIFDNKRSSSGGGNLMQEYLYTNLSQGEDDDATRGVDFLSNGFKNRNNFTALDASGGNYVYLAFAETPFKYANAK